MGGGLRSIKKKVGKVAKYVPGTPEWTDRRFHVNKKLGTDISDPAGLFADPAQRKHISADPTVQAQTAYEQTQESIQKQADFVKALQEQNYIASQADALKRQQGLETQLGAMASGTAGPSPAQAMLAQATGQNVANQAALMAGQRGAGSNVGLIARQAAQAGSAAQQQSLGQAATLRAQEQLAAIQAQQQQQQMLAGLTSAGVGQQQTAQSSLGAQALQQQANLLGRQNQVDIINAQIDQANLAAKQAADSRLLGTAGAVIGTFFGGPAGAKAGGTLGSTLATSGGGSSFYGTSGAGSEENSGLSNSLLNADSNRIQSAEGGQVTSQGMTGPRSAYGKMMMARGGKVPALVSPGEVYLKPNDVAQVAAGKKAPMDGEKIPGKAKVGGAKNDYANDTVKKVLDEGGIILPRSVTQSKDADKKAAEFVKAVLKNKLR